MISSEKYVARHRLNIAATLSSSWRIAKMGWKFPDLS